jgi:hypothetical protein
VEPDRSQMTVWRMRIACPIHKATNTSWEYVLFIVFPLQQLLQDCVSLFVYTYIASFARF